MMICAFSKRGTMLRAIDETTITDAVIDHMGIELGRSIAESCPGEEIGRLCPRDRRRRPRQAPEMRLAELARPRFPKSCRHHPGAHRFLAGCDVVPPTQLLARERWPAVVPLRLLQKLDGSRLCLAVDTPVRWPAPKPVHCNPVAIALHTLQQPSYPPIAYSHLFGGVSLRDHSVLYPLQPFQPISFLLAHRDSFHPSSLQLSRGTFYFAQLGTSHFAATIRSEQPTYPLIS